MANITDVVFAEKDTAAKIIDTLHRSDTEAFDAPQEIFESYQIPEMSKILQWFFISFSEKKIETDR